MVARPGYPALMSEVEPENVAGSALVHPGERPASALATSEEVVFFEGSPAILPGLGSWVLAVLTVGLYALFAWIVAKAVHYKITSQRVVIEHGLFSKRMEQIDLYRVVDYVVERPFGQRLVGTGNLILAAMDKTTPELKLSGLPTDVVKLYESLRRATEQEKRRRGVRVMDVETP